MLTDEKELPEIEKREGKNWIGLRIRNKGKITDIYINQLADGRLMHSNSWIEADGWSTDAYMFIVTYPEKSAPADAKEYFIGYGSSLKRGTPLISPRWQNYLLFRKKKIDACSYGLMAPPKVKAYIRSLQCPVSVSVNGESIPIVYDHSNLKIEL